MSPFRFDMISIVSKDEPFLLILIYRCKYTLGLLLDMLLTVREIRFYHAKTSMDRKYNTDYSD